MGIRTSPLVPGFIGYQFLNAAELMRDYEKWEKEDFERFKQWMIDVWFTTAQDFLERRHDTVVREGNWYHYHSNWGLGNALSVCRWASSPICRTFIITVCTG